MSRINDSAVSEGGTDATNAPASMAMSTRLVLAGTLAACCTLSIAVWYLDRAMHRGLIHEHEAILEDHLTAMRRAVQNGGGNLHQAREILHVSIGGDKNEKSYGSLVTAGGEVLEETPGFAAASPPRSAFPPPVEAADSAITIQTSTTGQGHPVFIAAARIARPGAPEPLTYYMTADAVPEQHFMRGFRWQLAGVVVAGTLLSAVLGWIITRRGLRPLREITRHIETTTAKALQQADPPDGSSAAAARRWPGELARLAAAFASLRTRLSRSFRQIQQFSDDAAHEIRTPLNNMLSSASLTLQRDRTPEEYRAALLSNLEECERLRKLADGLLFISRAEHRSGPLAVTTFDAARAIREIVEFHEDLAAEKGIAVRMTAFGNLTADRTLFRQALTNLLGNALRHTPAGGWVDIDFRPANADEASAVLTVSDSGEGIAQEHLPHIFDRFYRIDTARSHNPAAPPQTGLGLAIVKAIVDLHHGAITAGSDPGKGATFTLGWPRGIATGSAGP